MIVDQVDAFKSWLTAVLKPMCEADPAALAKYVLALIKKDKSEAELRKSMVGQLEVFLEGETENFVNVVFQALTTKEYINTPNVIPSANPPNPNVTKTVKEKETKVIIPPSELPNLSEAVNGDAKKENEAKGKEKVVEIAEKEERPPPRRPRSRNRSLSRNRSKSRSRSWDRTNTRRSRSREKSSERPERIRDRISDRLNEKFGDRLGERIIERVDKPERVERIDRPERSDRPERGERLERIPERLGERPDREYRIDREKRERDRRPWRKSPPIRRYERRRSRSSRTPSPIRMRSRSRSPRHPHRNRFKSSRSRSRSLEKRDRKDSKENKELSRPGSPSQDSSLNNNALSSASKRRCRDFDEKGYCMKGEMCPFDHGLDPVVLEDAALSRVLSLNPSDSTGTLPSSVITNPLPPGAGPLPPVVPPMRLPINEPPYNPQAPHMWGNGRFRGPRPMGGMPMAPFIPQPPGVGGMQRELIPVPVVNQQGPPPGYAPGAPPYGHPGSGPPMYGPGGMPMGSQPGMEQAALPPGMYKKKPFDYNRLGGQMCSRMKNPTNSSLELKKVPVALNSITHLNNHFSKFGRIVNIQVGFEGDPESALITFQNHADANAAYRSTEAVLNNRFIKVFWHNIQPPGTEGKQENVPPSQENVAVKDRLGGSHGLVPPNSNKVLNLVQPTATNASNGTDTDNKDGAKELTKEETKEEAQKAIFKNQEMLAAQVKVNKNKVEQHKEVLKIQSDLRKKKQELLEKQLSQQKILLEKLIKLPAGPQRDLIKETIKKTQESIESIKKDIEQSALAAKTATLNVKKTKEQLQKELLDMELEIIAKQQEGADTTEIQKKVLELKTRLGASIRGGRGRGRGVARFNPIVSRHLLSKNNLVDNRLRGNVKLVNRTSITNLPTSPIKSGITSPIVATPSSKVDHRPTRLLISGYETEEQEAVLAHFQKFGDVVDYVIDTSLPSITLNYKTRKEAEGALLKGKHFQDRTLSITWSTAPPRLQSQKSGGSSTRTVLLSESDEDHLIDQSLLEGDDELGPEISEEALLQDDDDEDEEDRSWRR